MSDFDYPIPSEVKSLWQKVNVPTQTAIPLNIGLIFDRYLPRWDLEKEHKNEAIKAFPRYTDRADSKLLQAWNTRWDAMITQGGGQAFNLQTDWRFVTGLGAKGPLEIGFAFHRYGFPYLPGSGLKGVARACALIEIAELRGTTQLKALDEALSTGINTDFEKAFVEDKEQKLQASHSASLESRGLADVFRMVFGIGGTDGQMGQAIFFDGIPAEVPTLAVDIMNPHYPKYYNNPTSEPPTDSQNPIPVLFLTVAPHQPFRFAVGWGGKPNSTARSVAETWLKKGLLTLGAGAKTSAGYGYFKDIIETQSQEGNSQSIQTVQTDPEEERINQIITAIQNMRSDNVAGQINNYAEAWRNFKGSITLKRRLAVAIKAKVESSSARKNMRKKEWYQQLVTELE